MKENLALEALADALARKVKRHTGVTPHLQIVATPKVRLAASMDSVTRMCAIRRIQMLARVYRLHILLEQGIFGLSNIEQLEDDALRALLEDMERGRECVVEGVSLEEAGLIRSTCHFLMERSP